jgi:hypothetical protein
MAERQRGTALRLDGAETAWTPKTVKFFDIVVLEHDSGRRNRKEGIHKQLGF